MHKLLMQSRLNPLNAVNVAGPSSRAGRVNGSLSETFIKASTHTGAKQDAIEEYQFDSEEEEDITSDNDYDSDAAWSHISVSSSESPGSRGTRYAMDERPWLKMDDTARQAYESIFISVTYPAVGDSWMYTEDYQQKLDEEMLMYIEDYPVQSWLCGRDMAERAYNNLRERIKWRELGIRVYNAERLPELLRRGGTLLHPAQYMVGAPYGHPQMMYTPVQPSQPPIVPPPPASPQQINPPAPPPHIRHAANLGQFDPAGTGLYASVLLKHVGPGRAKKPVQPTTKSRQSSKGDETEDDAADQIKNHSRESPAKVLYQTPPYPVHTPPARRINSKQLKPIEFPWHRRINYKRAVAKAEWSEDYRDPATIEDMERVRAHNAPILANLDGGVHAKQLRARESKKRRDAGQGDSSDALGKGGRRKKDPNNKDDRGDLYHSGGFMYATDEDEERAADFDCKSIKHVIEKAMKGQIKLEALHNIRVCWHPGTKGSTHNFQIASFTLAESIITRQRMETTPIFTRPAALCIIDYCPDLLFREVLLRITSEVDIRNVDVRERFCLNGCYADKATFAKRISAALGQKQLQGKNPQHLPGEKEYYNLNNADYCRYSYFIGQRTKVRSARRGQRKASISSSTSAASDRTDDVIHVAHKRVKLSVDGAYSDSSAVDTPLGSDVEMDDAVSVQDSDDLDMLSD